MLDELIKARKLISDRNNWTRNTLAHMPDGYPTHPTDKKACAWCATGAVMKATGDSDEQFLHLDTIEIINRLNAKCRDIRAGPGIRYANDVGREPGEKHATVLRIFDEVIEDLKEKGNQECR